MCAEAYDWGCKNDKCWSRCVGFAAIFPYIYEWCYTTKGRSQDYNYIKCSSESDCDPCWKCGGPCSAF